MHNFKIAFTGLVLYLSFFLSGCQEVGDDLPEPTPSNIDNNLTSISIVLPSTAYNLTTNSEIVTIKVNVYDEANNPHNEGVIKIIYPNDVKEGRDIGSFVSSEVSIVNGVAEFEYKGPSDLSSNTSNISFNFYHNTDVNSVKEYNLTLSPIADQVILTSYKLTTSIQDENLTINLDSSKIIAFSITDKDDNLVPQNDVEFIKITLINERLANLKNTTGLVSNTITQVNKNTVSVSLNTNTITGIIPIEVQCKFKDVNGGIQELSRVFNVLVLSGPPTAISLSYGSSDIDKTSAKLIEKWVVTVTDKYNNRVNTNPAVSMGMMAGYAKSSATPSNPNNYLYYENSLSQGTLNGSTDTFTTPASVFTDVDLSNFYLVTFGNGYTYDASGKWSIGVNSNGTELDLIDDFNGTSTSNLGFAVGNNYRQDQCRFGVEWVANTYPENDKYTIDDQGNLVINVAYDYYLIAKDVILWVNLVGKKSSTDFTGRIGESKKITLRGKGIGGPNNNGDIVQSFSAGFSGPILLPVFINETGERLRNSHFTYAYSVVFDDINLSKDTVWTDTSTSKGDIYSCNSGVSYVEVNFPQPTVTGGKVILNTAYVSPEF